MRRYYRGIRFDLSRDIDVAHGRSQRLVKQLYSALKEVNMLAQKLEQEVPIGERLTRSGVTEGYAEKNRQKVKMFNEYEMWYSKLDSMLSATTKWSESLMKQANEL